MKDRQRLRCDERLASPQRPPKVTKLFRMTVRANGMLLRCIVWRGRTTIAVQAAAASPQRSA
ncbi:MAG: hypothetical protein GIW99_05165 [Candidatus Eremiobacteraeota bacterium]|nr:hypothetical protein [Candidatus Eremiobacteraeota bacterium]MBC5827056.1 hypothetical protein [Candidatus Eremiobacteraeota bacterium]